MLQADLNSLWNEAGGDQPAVQPTATPPQPSQPRTPATLDSLWNEAGGDQHPDYTGPIADTIFNMGHLKRIGEAFGQGFSQGYGALPTEPDLEKSLRGIGVWDDYHNGQANVLKQINEAWMRPILAGAMNANPLRPVWGALTGAMSAAEAFGTESKEVATANLARDAQTGIQGAIHAPIDWLQGAAGELIGATPGGGTIGAEMPHIIDARANAAIGETEDTFFGLKRPTPEQAAGRNAAIKAGIRVPQPQDVHIMARDIAPDVFKEYDDLLARRTTARDPAKIAEINDRIKELSPDVSTAYRLAGEDLSKRVRPAGEPASTFIADDVTKKLQDAGRPEDEARANGQVVQALYETHAARFGGKLGTAEDIYGREAPEIRAGDETGTYSQYAGVRSAVAPKEQFNQAVQMLQSGADPEKVRIATGWFKNPLDGKWRFEFSDDQAKLKPIAEGNSETELKYLPETEIFKGPSNTVPLDQILTHDKLFEHYPEARNIKVKKQSALFDMFRATQGWMQEDGTLAVTPYANDPLSTILHEVQHWIQQKEGFARGGNAQTVFRNLPPEKLKPLFEEAIAKLTERMNGSVKTIDRYRQAVADGTQNTYLIAHQLEEYAFKDYRKLVDLLKDPTKEEQLEIERANYKWSQAHDEVYRLKQLLREKYFGTKDIFALSDEEANQWSDLIVALERTEDPATTIEKLKDKFTSLQDKVTKLQTGDVDVLKHGVSSERAFELYSAIAGEIEARDVQARQSLTEEGRKAFEPMKSQTYNPEDVTVSYNQGAANDELGAVNKVAADAHSHASALHWKVAEAYDAWDGKTPNPELGKLRKEARDASIDAANHSSAGAINLEHLSDESAQHLVNARYLADETMKMAEDTWTAQKAETFDPKDLARQHRLIAAEHSRTVFEHDDVVMPEYKQGNRGSIQIVQDARNIIRLASTADASTFMHETAHDWLERLMRDSLRPDAPPDLVADANTLNKWMKRGEGKPLTDVHHEKFAAAWEKYLMTGKAPTQALVPVFERFKQWMTQIYKALSNIKNSATGKGFKMTDDVRDVFARMLTQTPDYTGEGLRTPDLRASDETTGSTEGATLTAEDGTVTKIPGPTVDKAPGPELTSDSPVTYNQSDYISKDGKINTKSIFSNDHVENFMRAWAETHHEFIEERGYGWTPTDTIEAADTFRTTTRNMQRNLAFMEKNITNNAIPLAVRVKALEDLLNQNGEQLLQDIENGDMEAAAESALRTDAIFKTVAGVRTAWGQVGQALQLGKAGADRAGLITDLFQARFKMTEEQFRVQASIIKGLDTPAKINAYVRRMLDPSWGDYMLEAYKNYLISGPLTHIQYLLGAEQLTLMAAGPERYAAYLAGRVRETFLGGLKDVVPSAGGVSPNLTIGSTDILRLGEKLPDGWTYKGPVKKDGSRVIEYVGTKVEKGEVWAGLNAWFFGHQDALKAAGTAFKEGQTVALPGEDVASTPFTTTRAIPGTAGHIFRAPGERMVAPIHSYNRTLGYMPARASLIFRQVVNEGLEPGTPEFFTRQAELYNDTPLSITEKAAHEATELALMGRAGEWTRRMQTFVSGEVNIPKIGRLQPLAFVSPFVHIAGNIGRMALLERSPLGLGAALFSKAMRDDLTGVNGTLAQDTAIGKMAAGTAVWAAMGGLYLTGHANPGPDPDYKKATTDKMANGLPYSIRIGDMTYAFDRLGVYGLVMATGTDLWASLGQIKDWKDPGDYGIAASHFGTMLLQHISTEGFLSGLSDMMKAKDEPGRFGASWVKNFFSSAAVPFSVGMSQMSQLVDPNQRYVRPATRDFWGALSDTIVDKIPFASESLPAKIDIFGNPVPNRDFAGVYALQASQDPMIQHFDKEGYFPAPVKNDINGIKLTPEQYNDYATMSGQQLRVLLQNIFDNPTFNQWGAENQRLMIEKQVGQARHIARGLMSAKYPNIPADAGDAKKNLAQGYLPKP